MTRRAIFYLTYNGVFNNTNGIGTQTKTFLAGIERHYSTLAAEFGPFDVHLIAPAGDSSWWGYCEDDLRYARAAIGGLGGAVHFCPPGGESVEFWSPEGWRLASSAAAGIVLDRVEEYVQTLVIANDIPFLHTPAKLAQELVDSPAQLDAVIALYGSSYIHTPLAVDPERVTWEVAGLAAAEVWPRVKVADVGEFMRQHLADRYGVSPGSFAPYRSSLDLANPEFAPKPTEEILAELRRHSIPEDRPLLVAFGRADWIKGFDLLLEALREVREPAHLVLNVVPYTAGAPILAEYREAIRRYRLDVTLLTGFSRTLPAALCQWPRTVAVICPSRGEPLSNVPFEVSLWAQTAGPVLVCANRDGYTEQVEAGQNGLLFEPEHPADLAARISEAINMREPKRRSMRRRAFARVMAERDFYTNFRQTLRSFWR